MNKGRKGIILQVLIITGIIGMSMFPSASLVFAQEGSGDKITEKITEKTTEKDPITEKEKVTETVTEKTTEKDPIKQYTEVVQEYDLRIIYEPTLETLRSLGTNLAQSATLITGFIITIFIGWLAGRFAQGVLRRIITKWFEHPKLLKLVGMEKKEFEESGWSQVHNLIPFTVKWFVWLAFFIVAVDLLQIPQATGALTELWTWIPRIVVFIILISVGFIVSRIALRWMSETKPELFGKEGQGQIKIAKGLVQGIIFAVIFGIGITTLGIGQEIIPILFWVILAGFMGMGIAISVGLRHIATSWSNGESVKRLGVIKDAEITVGNHKGVVLEIGLTHTKIKDADKIKLIPNNTLNTTEITIDKHAIVKETDRQKNNSTSNEKKSETK